MKETKTVALSAALVLLVWAGVAQAEPRAFPLEPQFVQKDLVVAGKVIKVDEPVHVHLRQLDKHGLFLAGEIELWQ